MVTEKEFLDAMDIVKAYQSQINTIVNSISPKNVRLKRGDIIRITKVSPQAGLIKLGAEYRVVNFNYYAKNDFQFREYLDDKYGKNRNLTIEQYDAEFKNVPHYACVEISMGNKKYRDFRTKAGYEYELVKSAD